MKRLLIVGASGYIGKNLERYLNNYSGGNQNRYKVETLSLRDRAWEEKDFSGYDSVIHLVGKAHADISRMSEEEQQEYYAVNCDLAVKVASIAKNAGVSQFIYMSSVIVYGDSAGVGKQKHITENTEPAPSNFYGDSKWKAEQELQKLADEHFHIAFVRSPMVYGPESKGNFPMLLKFARRLPVFPKVQNQRSMIYIGNLTEFLRLLAESGLGGIFLPQNASYISTAELVEMIGEAQGRRIHCLRILNLPVLLAGVIPGKVGKMVNKAFGSLTIEQGLTGDIGDYRIYSWEESIRESVGTGKANRSGI